MIDERARARKVIVIGIAAAVVVPLMLMSRGSSSGQTSVTTLPPSMEGFLGAMGVSVRYPSDIDGPSPDTAILLPLDLRDREQDQQLLSLVDRGARLIVLDPTVARLSNG